MTTENGQVDISFIIPHKGRENLLLQTLHSIFNQQAGDYRFETILVTQNESLSDDITGLSGNNPLKIFYQPENLTISALRNHGVLQADGDYLAFLDADVALSENWITAMLNHLCKDTSIALVSAVQKNSTAPTPLETVRTALSNVDTDAFVNFLPGRNLFITRSHFQTVGGFPEHLVTCEDYYFTDRVNQLGRLLYSSDATYVHLGEDKDYGEMFKKEIWRGQSNFQSLQGRRVPLSEYPSFIVPPAILLLFILAVFLAATGNLALAGLALGASLLPVLLYSLRLYRKNNHNINFWPILKFYLLYFPARAIGTTTGIFKQITTGDHS